MSSVKVKSKSKSQELGIKNPRDLHDDLFKSSDREENQEELDDIRDLEDDIEKYEEKIKIFEEKIKIIKKNINSFSQQKKDRAITLIPEKEKEIEGFKNIIKNKRNEIKNKRIEIENKKKSLSIELTPEITSSKKKERISLNNKAFRSFTELLKEEDKIYPQNNRTTAFNRGGKKARKARKTRKTRKNKI
jgi:hypothetical protein